MDAGLVEPMAGKLRLKIRQSQSRSPLRGHGDSSPQTRPLAAASRMWQARATQAAEGWQMEWTSAFRASPWRRGGWRINDELAPMTQTKGEFDGTLHVRSVHARCSCRLTTDGLPKLTQPLPCSPLSLLSARRPS